MPSTFPSPRQVAIVGPGRLGLSLAVALKRRGYKLAAVMCRPGSAQRRLPGPAVADAEALYDALDAPALVFITVPDRKVGEISEVLAADPRCKRHGFVHTSGVQGAEALAYLKRHGASIAAFHPLQSFPAHDSAPSRFEGVFCAIEAPASLERALDGIARKLGMVPFRLAAKARPLYHLAAVLASNALVGLLDKGGQLMERAGLPRGLAEKLLLPLVQGTLDNVKAAGVKRALTGPVVRGDAVTLRRHLMLLEKKERALYLALMRQVLELAERSGRLKKAEAAAVKQALK